MRRALRPGPVNLTALVRASWAGGIAWTDVDVVHEKSGQATIRLSGVAGKVAEEKGVKSVLVSISHTDRYANAVAVAEG